MSVEETTLIVGRTGFAVAEVGGIGGIPGALGPRRDGESV